MDAGFSAEKLVLRSVDMDIMKQVCPKILLTVLTVKSVTAIF